MDLAGFNAILFCSFLFTLMQIDSVSSDHDATTTTPTPTAIFTLQQVNRPSPSTTQPTSRSTIPLTSPPLTTHGPLNDPTHSQRQALCNKVGQFTNKTTQEVVRQLTTELTINIRNTSRSKNLKISKYDKRTSATAIGWFGVTILVTVFGGILFIDLVPSAKTYRQN